MKPKRMKCKVCQKSGANLCLDCRAILDRLADLQTIFGTRPAMDRTEEHEQRIAEYKRRADERKPLFEKGR